MFFVFFKRGETNENNEGIKILIKEQESIKNSLVNTSEMVNIGRNVLTSLKFQGDSLKVVQIFFHFI